MFFFFSFVELGRECPPFEWSLYLSIDDGDRYILLPLLLSIFHAVVIFRC